MLNLLYDVCLLFIFIGSLPSTGKRKSPPYNILWRVTFSWVEVPRTLFPVRTMKAHMGRRDIAPLTLNLRTKWR
jgi:hypothetical protein